MPNHHQSLPENPDLRHLKDQAKDLLKSGRASTLTQAQFQIAQSYGFASWPKLKSQVESLKEVGRLKQAIDDDDLDLVKSLMTAHPALHQAPLGYSKNGPLTWAAECRFESPTGARLAIAKWMLEHGSDVHQGSDGPLMRAALRGERISMMELLVQHGADVNAHWNGDFPILFAPCETIAPEAIRWLLEHGANPNCTVKTTALDYLIGTYARSEELNVCIDLLRAAGGTTRYDLPGVLDTIQDRPVQLGAQLDADSSLLHRRFPELDCGSTGARRLLLTGATLLHVAAEFGSVECAELLIARGADVNAAAARDASGGGGQTPIFHSATQFDDGGLPMTRLLLAHGTSLTVRARVPGHYERPGEVLKCTPLEYATLFPNAEFPGSNTATLALLSEHL